jgi:hypothetical protein
MYEDRVLAFIDVLGFSEAVKNTIKNDTEDETETNKIDNLIKNLQWDLNFDKDEEGKHFNSKVVSQFSDSLIISYLMTEEAGIFKILLDLLYICATALYNGFLLRGAVVCDKVYHIEKKVFGPALVKAYEMEKNLAIYPRIILDDNIISIAMTYHLKDHDSETEINHINELILKDFDGLNYINYFDAIESELDAGFEEMPEYLDNLRNIIKKMEEIDKFSVKSKYLWLKEKYNFVITNYKKNYDNERAMHEYPELYDYYKNITLL